jgi:hypothetical protein
MTARFSLVAAAAAVVLSLAACTSDDPEPGPGAPTPAPTTTTTPTAAAETTAPGGSGDCGSVADDVESVIASRAVDRVEVDAQCSTLVITTTLGDGEAPPAKEICDAAAKVAYTGDVDAIRVTSLTGTELARGTAGGSCRAQ